MEQLAKRAVERHDSAPLFECYDLGDGNRLQTGSLPSELRLDAMQFETLWRLRPSEFDKIMMHGRLVPTPRWQQAYGKDYHYSGQVNEALPTPAILEPLIAWAKGQIDDRLNAILVNWYDGILSHYIGRHRDNRANGIVGLSPTLASSQLNAVRLHTTFKMNYLPAGKRGSFCFNFKTGLKRSPSFLTRDTASVADGALDNQGALSRSTTFAFTASQHSGDTPSGQSRHTTTRTKP